MNWPRDYLQRHNIHRAFEDCVEQLIMKRPQGREAIAECIVARLKLIHASIENPPQTYIVLLAAGKAQNQLWEAAEKSASQQGAKAINAAGKSPEEIAKEIRSLSPQSKFYIVNLNSSIHNMMQLEGVLGIAKQLIFVTSKDFQQDEEHFLRECNPLLELFRSRGRFFQIDSQKGLFESGAIKF